MFCIGPAPTEPGIRAKFSRPNIFFERDHSTKSCQFSPEATSTIKSSSCFIPISLFFTTSPLKGLEGTIFVPSPRNKRGIFL